MHGAKKHIHRSLIPILLALYVAGCLLFALAQRDVSNKAYETFRSKARHAQAARGPRRILLTGGSNVIWGYRSALLEQLTGVPTTNLGIEREADDPAALRRLILSLVRRGDTVVYSSISFWHTDSFDAASGQALLLAAGLGDQGDSVDQWRYHWARYWSWAPRDMPLALRLPGLFRRYVLQEPSQWVAAYNEYGDIKACEHGDPRHQAYVSPPEVEPYLAAMLDYRSQLHRRGAELVIDLSWLYVKPEERDLWLKTYQPLLERFNAQLLLAEPRLAEVLHSEIEPFCNSCNHITDDAAILRTKHLAGFLSAHLPQAVFGKDGGAGAQDLQKKG